MLAVCPSGMSANVRGLRGAETNLFADEKSARAGDMFDRILSACVLEIENPGPYVLKGDSLDWPDVLTCDREYLLMCIRIDTYGPEYSTAYKCPMAACQAKFYWDLDLRDLDIIDLDESTIAKVAAGDNSFDMVVDGTTFSFKLMTGRDELRAMKLLRQNKSQRMTTALSTRVIKIDGEAKQPASIAEYFVKYDRPLTSVMEAMTSIDGGVDNEIEIECPECGGGFETRLPLDGKDFWLQQKSRKTAKAGRKRRTLRDSD